MACATLHPLPYGQGQRGGKWRIEIYGYDFAERLDAALADLARAKTCRVLAGPATPVDAAYLVNHQNTNEFIDRAPALHGTIDGAEIEFTGPWPPYSFVGSSRP